MTVMTTNRRRCRHVGFALCALAALLAVSCATSRGSTLQTVAAAQSGSAAARPPSSPTEQPVPSPLVSKQGLEIISTPDNAEVWIDGSFRGLSPYIAETIGTGWHRITLRKQGYYEASGWVDFESDYMLYQATLNQVMGYLQISIVPADSIVSVGGQKVSAGLQQFPVGTYTLEAKAFGFTEQQQSLTITEQATTAVDIQLVPAEFAITSLTLPKELVNPANPGMIGYLDCTFSVTGPGTGRLTVRDADGITVFSEPLAEFTTWDQSVSWNVRDASGRELPDGEYFVTLDAHGKESGQNQTADARFRVDSTLKIATRSLWSGSAGLLYAPVAEVLPDGDFQVAVLGAGIAAGYPSLFQAPVQVGARIGMGKDFELDASAGLIASSVSLPITASLAGRWNFVTPRGAYGTGAALQGKISFQYNPTVSGGDVLLSDTFANFTGLSVEMPFQVSLGPVSLLLSFGAEGSLWYPYRADAFNAPVLGPVAWMYLRAGVLLDVGSVTAGISASTRTEPLPGGVAFLGTPVPFQLGAEIHWLLPDSRLFLSAIAAGEYEDGANYYFMGGLGLGFLY
jgi:hypothetical protein